MAKIDVDSETVALLNSVAESLVRIAEAQEVIAAIMKADLQDEIAAAVEDGAQQRAAEIVESKSKRSYIGKRQA